MAKQETPRVRLGGKSAFNWKFLAYSFGLQFTLGYLTLSKILAYVFFSGLFVLMIWCFTKLWQEKNNENTN